MLKSPLRCVLPTVVCSPPYGDALGKLTLIGAVVEWILELGGPQGVPKLGEPGFELGLPVG